jgi:hypothetical protein
MPHTLKYLRKRGFSRLAALLEETMEATPYKRHRQRRQDRLWHEQVALNLPLLYLACRALREWARSQGCTRYLFATRDCVHLHRIFGALYPREEVHYFDCSRNMFESATQHRNRAFDAYVARVTGGDPKSCVYVDVHGTGERMYDYFDERCDSVPACFLVSCGITGPSHLPHGSTKMLRAGRLKILEYGISGTPIEMLNYAKIGTLNGYDKHGPQRAAVEYDVALIEPYHACVETFVGLLSRQHRRHEQGGAAKKDDDKGAMTAAAWQTLWTDSVQSDSSTTTTTSSSTSSSSSTSTEDADEPSLAVIEKTAAKMLSSIRRRSDAPRIAKKVSHVRHHDPTTGEAGSGDGNFFLFGRWRK